MRLRVQSREHRRQSMESNDRTVTAIDLKRNAFKRVQAFVEGSLAFNCGVEQAMAEAYSTAEEYKENGII
jgi:hypothetical protein